MSQTITYVNHRTEMLKVVFNIIGVPSYLLGIMWNLDNIKGAILAIIGIIYMSVQLCFFIDKSLDNRRIRKINRWREEQKAIKEGWRI